MEITQICRIGDKEPKILINFVVHILKQLIKLLHPHWQTFACTCMSVHVVDDGVLRLPTAQASLFATA